jgi:hypothetical protein
METSARQFLRIFICTYLVLLFPTTFAFVGSMAVLAVSPGEGLALRLCLGGAIGFTIGVVVDCLYLLERREETK